ncbi:MAG: enoyl-CoA hydratase/isomerase family protein [Alphaproteobacteria bacterium]|nr:enoyl-CoA hydratase/isomerase family protein [Alphaproteobacteria bacterium]
MAFEKILFAIEDGLATLTLNKPDVLNAVCPATMEEMAAALAETAKPGSGARVLLLTGAGRGFCSGADLASGGGGPRDPLALLERYYHPVVLAIMNLDIPVVTGVNGVAAGAGMSLALLGDLVLAAEGASFLQAFRRIGYVPDAGSTWLLPRLVGRARALELSLLGEKLSARKALEWGLVTRVLPDEGFPDAAKAFARDIANGPSVALGLTRRLYWQSETSSLEAQLSAEARAQSRCSRTHDNREGIKAFLEKRPAKFEGR